MRKVIISESKLISLVELMVNEASIMMENTRNDLKTYYVIEATNNKKRFYFGEYKDGSTLFIPTINFSEYNSKPKFYGSESDAEKDLDILKKYVPTYTYEIKPFGK
jgi:hypothetical protein